MFPVDPDNKRTSNYSSSITTRREQFREDVAERDGRTCLLSNLQDILCGAVHLLPHSKGDRVSMLLLLSVCPWNFSPSAVYCDLYPTP